MESFRDWGRDCWCDPGKENTCGKRFDWQLGELPCGYDHKYTYTHIGYNLKATDMQAAWAWRNSRAARFIAARRKNFATLQQALGDLTDLLILPEATPAVDPSWFGFPIAVRPDGTVTRDQVIALPREKQDRHPALFGGNLLRQPAYAGRASHDRRAAQFRFYHEQRVLGENYPGITADMLDYMTDVFHQVRKSAAQGA